MNSNLWRIIKKVDGLLEDVQYEIGATPTGPERDALTDLQIMLMDQQTKMKKLT